MKREINGLYEEELREYFKELDLPSYRGVQLYNHIHRLQRGKNTLVNGFPKDLSEKIFEDNIFSETKIIETLESKNKDTIKWAMKLNDGQIIEAVFMKYTNRNTICISTQLGCAMGCVFCASGKEGLERNLTAGEITQQYYSAEKAVKEKIQNIVLMGIGEPLHNYEEVIKALRLLNSKNGRNLSYRNMSLSTCGLVPEIRALAEENIPINLIISLHAAEDEKRKKLMPIANVYPIKDIIEACDYYFDKTGRRVSYQYTLMSGINDKKEDLNNLIKLFKGKNTHINLIPYNEIEEFSVDSLDRKEIERFSNYLNRCGIKTTIRKSAGLEEEGACGQLRANIKKKEL